MSPVAQKLWALGSLEVENKKKIENFVIFGSTVLLRQIWGTSNEQIRVDFLSWLVDLISYQNPLRNKIIQFCPTSALNLLD